MLEPSIQALLDGLAAELGAPVAVSDLEFRLIAHTAHTKKIDEVRRRWLIDRRTPDDVRVWLEELGVDQVHAPTRFPAKPSLGLAHPRWCVPLRFSGRHLGYVWV